jgi:N-acetyl-gamma-glutamylphosphate reductase
VDTEGIKFTVIITGATGMVGEGVLLECLEHPAVELALLVSTPLRSEPSQVERVHRTRFS